MNSYPTSFLRRLRKISEEWYPELILLFIILWMVLIALVYRPT